jgi:hypothetical protein
VRLSEDRLELGLSYSLHGGFWGGKNTFRLASSLHYLIGAYEMPSGSVVISVFPGEIPELPATEIGLELQGPFLSRCCHPSSFFLQEGDQDLDFTHGDLLSQGNDPPVFIECFDSSMHTPAQYQSANPYSAIRSSMSSPTPQPQLCPSRRKRSIRCVFPVSLRSGKKCDGDVAWGRSDPPGFR